ncbi:TPA: transposase [Candidatus Poribacteria bacterium]|nr:transposase [Candidatus Poribacteria bacterium]HIN75026.1 transposase [Rhodospirillales bacterium]HIO82100.1 transposase [Candidatus Poribacteria bacterium]
MRSPSRPMGSTTDSQCHLLSGYQWRMLAKDFPPGQTVYTHYCKWCQEEKWF